MCNIPNSIDGLKYIRELKTEKYNIFKIFKKPIDFIFNIYLNKKKYLSYI